MNMLRLMCILWCYHNLTRGQNFLLHSLILLILHREPVLQHEEEQVISLWVPHHHMLNVPGWVQTCIDMYQIQLHSRTMLFSSECPILDISFLPKETIL